ncbi:hypothetical protein K2173_023453 [Erythroxylum novogranatense]|uniref:C3H1-type domain-containing protein n=1 Tax=Erythroxylum novogranatense TaxID=1862640 RepID=A0AAV8TYB1_9ROSI|nr:hypothetical protein K2173_023453 [Erythroxylum novogranatense]
MKRSGKVNRVSWASDRKLCQVKLYVPEDCPSKVGVQTPHHPNRKTTGILQTSKSRDSSDFPPGFERSDYLNPLKELPCIRRIEWKCPPNFVMSYSWDVAAGEQSHEAETQKLRELRVLEAMYPHPSAIPACPSVSLETECEYYDDSLTPAIPLIPIEEVEVECVPPKIPTSDNTPFRSQSLPLYESLHSSKLGTSVLETPFKEKQAPGKSSGQDADIITAASAAVAAISKSKEHGSLIDTDLLVKIFKDPQMIQKLMNVCKEPDLVANPVPVLVPIHDLPSKTRPISKPAVSSDSVSSHKASTSVTPTPTSGALLHISNEKLPSLTAVKMPIQPETVPVLGLKRTALSIPSPTPEPISVSAARPIVGNFYSNPRTLQHALCSITNEPKVPNASPLVSLTSGMMPPKPTSVVAMPGNSVKDMNYMKNLIREHGMGKPEMQDQSILLSNTCHNLIKKWELAENVKLPEAKAKFPKACMYFNSSRGCRNGLNCPYKHDLSFGLRTGGALAAPVAKRMKLEAGITGRT